jgi:hypothetical protein
MSLPRSLTCALTALAVAAASCSTMHKVPVVPASPGQPIAWQVKAGDTIRVMLRDGGSSEFKVQSVTPEAIISSDGTRYEQANITSVERRGISPGKTAGAAAGGLGVVFLVVVLVGVFSFLSWLGGGGGV